MRVNISNVSCQLSNVSQSPEQSSPQWGNPILISITFGWVNDTDLCNGACVCSCGHLYLHISFEAVFSGKHLHDFIHEPFSSYCVCFCYYDEITDPYIPAFCVPFLSWHEVRKNITRPPLQNEWTIIRQNSTLWRRLSVWRNGPWGTLFVALLNKDVIWIKVSAIVGIIWNSANWSFIYQICHFK